MSLSYIPRNPNNNRGIHTDVRSRVGKLDQFAATQYVLSGGAHGRAQPMSDNSMPAVCVTTSNIITVDRNGNVVAFMRANPTDTDLALEVLSTVKFDTIDDDYKTGGPRFQPGEDIYAPITNTIPTSFDVAREFDVVAPFSTRGQIVCTRIGAGANDITGTITTAVTSTSVGLRQISEAGLKGLTAGANHFSTTEVLQSHTVIMAGDPSMQLITGNSVDATAHFTAYQTIADKTFWANGIFKPVMWSYGGQLPERHAMGTQLNVNIYRITPPGQDRELFVTINVRYIQVDEVGDAVYTEVYDSLTLEAPGDSLDTRSYTRFYPNPTNTGGPGTSLSYLYSIEMAITNQAEHNYIEVDVSAVLQAKDIYTDGASSVTLIKDYDGPIHLERETCYCARPNNDNIRSYANQVSLPAPSAVRDTTRQAIYLMFGSAMGLVFSDRQVLNDYLGMVGDPARLIKALGRATVSDIDLWSLMETSRGDRPVEESEALALNDASMTPLVEGGMMAASRGGRYQAGFFDDLGRTLKQFGQGALSVLSNPTLLDNMVQLAPMFLASDGEAPPLNPVLLSASGRYSAGGRYSAASANYYDDDPAPIWDAITGVRADELSRGPRYAAATDDSVGSNSPSYNYTSVLDALHSEESFSSCSSYDPRNEPQRPLVSDPDSPPRHPKRQRTACCPKMERQARFHAAKGEEGDSWVKPEKPGPTKGMSAREAYLIASGDRPMFKTRPIWVKELEAKIRANKEQKRNARYWAADRTYNSPPPFTQVKVTAAPPPRFMPGEMSHEAQMRAKCPSTPEGPKGAAWKAAARSAGANTCSGFSAADAELFENIDLGYDAGLFSDDAEEKVDFEDYGDDGTAGEGDEQPTLPSEFRGGSDLTPWEEAAVTADHPKPPTENPNYLANARAIINGYYMNMDSTGVGPVYSPDTPQRLARMAQQPYKPIFPAVSKFAAYDSETATIFVMNLSVTTIPVAAPGYSPATNPDERERELESRYTRHTVSLGGETIVVMIANEFKADSRASALRITQIALSPVPPGHVKKIYISVDPGRSQGVVAAIDDITGNSWGLALYAALCGLPCGPVYTGSIDASGALLTIGKQNEKVSAFTQDSGLRLTTASPLFIPRKNFAEQSYEAGTLSAPAMGVRLGRYDSVSATGVAPIDTLNDIWSWFLRGGYALELRQKKDIFSQEKASVTDYYTSSRSASAALAAQKALSNLSATIRKEGRGATKAEKAKGQELIKVVEKLKLRAFKPREARKAPSRELDNQRESEKKRQAAELRDQRKALVLKDKTHSFIKLDGSPSYKYGDPGTSVTAKDQWAAGNLKGTEHTFVIKPKHGPPQESMVFVPEVKPGKRPAPTKREKKQTAYDRAARDLFSDNKVDDLFS